jgi:hypothetical protein
MSDSESGGSQAGPFRYHLELTPPQLKITYTALHSLLDDFGHEESDVMAIIHEVLAKLPDEHAIRAIRLEDGLEGKLERTTPSDLPRPDEDPPGPTAA